VSIFTLLVIIFQRNSNNSSELLQATTVVSLSYDDKWNYGRDLRKILKCLKRMHFSGIFVCL